MPRSLKANQPYVVSPHVVSKFGLNELTYSLEEQNRRIVVRLEQIGHFHPRSGRSGCTLT